MELVEVDLCWKITKEQADRSKILPACLAEIENCQPYFISVLGERYGWVSDSIDPELMEMNPWLTYVAGRTFYRRQML